MDHFKLQRKAEGGPERQQEELLEGVGTGEVRTPGRGEESARTKRRRCHSLDSPEILEEVLVGDSHAKELRDEIDMNVEEIRGYTLRALGSKDNRHENYLYKRCDKIEAAAAKLMEEVKRVRQIGRLAEKVVRIDRELKRWGEIDIGECIREQTRQVVEEVARRVGEEALSSSRAVQERMREDVDTWIRASEGADEQLQGDVKALEEKYQERMERLDKKMEEMGQKMREMGSFMENVRTSMDVVNTNVCKLGEVVEGVPWNSVEEVGKKLEVIRTADVAGVREEVDRVREAVKVVTEAVGKVRMEDRMEVDQEEGDIPFAEVVKRGRRRREVRGPQVVVEAPKEGERRKREDLVRALDPKEGEVRVKAVWRRGKDFVVEEDIGRLRGNEKLKESGFLVNGEPWRRNPTVMIYGVDKEVSREDLLKATRGRNKEVFEGVQEEEVGREFVPRRMRPGGLYTNNWVVQVAPRLFKRLMALGRLYVGVRACRVDEYVDVLRCNKCLGLGHVGQRCGRPVTCARCGEEGHHATRCSSTEGARCANCKRMGFKEFGHSTMWAGCPVAELQRGHIRRNTRYEV